MAQVADNDSRNSICLMAGCTVSYDFAGLADPRSISETCFMNTYCVLAHLCECLEGRSTVPFWLTVRVQAHGGEPVSLREAFGW